MGMEIIYSRQCTFIHKGNCLEAENANDEIWSLQADSKFPKHGRPLRPGCYRLTNPKKFIIGYHSEYHEWREKLAQQFTHFSADEIYYHPEAHNRQPYYWLINYADMGYFGTYVIKQLRKDFANHVPDNSDRRFKQMWRGFRNAVNNAQCLILH